MAKKKPSSKANPSLAKLKIFSFILLFIAAAFLVYDFASEQKSAPQQSAQKSIPSKTASKKSAEKPQSSINKTAPAKKPSTPKSEPSAFGDKVAATNVKAKLAIIIDDVASKQESQEILSIIKSGKKITPSFFPNTSNHPHTNEFAKDFASYMIHLPLRALSFNKEEPLTLTPEHDYASIESRIKSITLAFPRLRFINNHTGSAFTADEAAMKRLFKALSKYHLIFVDSRTTARTKAPELAAQFHQHYIHRDVFLDNSRNLQDIKKQLDIAVDFALKHKRAIAIAHPHANSLKAIKEYDFSKVELVFIDDIYNDYR